MLFGIQFVARILLPFKSLHTSFDQYRFVNKRSVHKKMFHVSFLTTGLCINANLMLVVSKSISNKENKHKMMAIFIMIRHQFIRKKYRQRIHKYNTNVLVTEK